METGANSIPEGMGWRVAVSILTFFATIVGIILWLFFFAGNFNAYQNIAAVVAILLGFVAVMGGNVGRPGHEAGAAERERRS